MAGKKQKNSNPNSGLNKFLRGFLDFCRKFGPKRAGIDSRKVKQLSFDSLRLIGNKQKKLDEINEHASELVKGHLDNVPGLLEFIENRGTRVIIHKHADKVVRFWGEIEGFLPPMSGFKARLILMSLKMIGAWPDSVRKETPALFVFGEEPTMGYMVHQIHHWLSFNNGLPGYTEETMNNFKKIFDPSFGVEDVKRMSKEEIISLREAIARDQEALDFVQKMAQEIFKPQDVLKGIKDGDKKNI